MKITGLDRFVESTEKQDGANFLIFVSGADKDFATLLVKRIAEHAKDRQSAFQIIFSEDDFEIEFVELKSCES